VRSHIRHFCDIKRGNTANPRLILFMFRDAAVVGNFCPCQERRPQAKVFDCCDFTTCNTSRRKATFDIRSRNQSSIPRVFTIVVKQY
jgi:hypothetical protein